MPVPQGRPASDGAASSAQLKDSSGAPLDTATLHQHSASDRTSGKDSTRGEKLNTENAGTARDGANAANEKVKLGTAEAKNGGKARWREKLPGTLKGPVDALFPSIPPSLVYGSNPPSFLVDACRRTAWRNRKHLFRALLVTLAAFILVLEPASLTVLGNASFFGMIVSVMIPPAAMPAVTFVLVAAMLIIGMCLGWAWSSAAMAASLRARSQILLASQVQRVNAGLAGATNPDAQYRISIFRGNFLDWRSTLVFGFFFGIGTFAFGLLRANQPKMMLVAVFASIVMDVMISYGPLFPIAQYTLATTFLIPTACYVAIAITSTIVIFPETLNSSWTTDLVDKFLSPILQRQHLHSKLLATPPPSLGSTTQSEADSAWSKFQTSWLATQESVSAALEGLLGSAGMMELEISYGRLSAKDLRSLTDAMRELLARSVGLATLSTVVETRRKRMLDLADSPTASQSPSASEDPKKGDKHPASHVAETVRMQRLRHRLAAAEEQHKHDLPSLLPIFETASFDLRQACDNALVGAMSWLTTQNQRRWRRQLSVEATDEAYAAQHARVEALSAELALYRTSKREALVRPFADFFDPATGKLLLHAADSIVFSPATLLTLLAASDNLVCYAEALLAFVRQVNALEGKRRRNKVWAPTGLRKVGNLLRGGKSNNTFAGDGENPDKLEHLDDEDDGEKKADERKAVEEVKADDHRDPDARQPKNGYQRATYKIYRLGQWMRTPETIFAIKFAIVSVALWLPQVFSSSAYFAYKEKFLWALIMAQTGLAVYSGDQILSSVQKIIGTGFGLVYGMLIWYIGAANGPGSRPGLGAAFFVCFIPAMAIRLYGPPASMQMSMMGAVTTVLVVGYSYQDTHLPSVGNPGVGYEVAWRRALLVVCGTAAATIMMMLPPVSSSRQLVRLTHSTCISELGRIYTGIISAWLGEEQSSESASGFSLSAQKAARARMLALRLKLNSSRVSILQSTYEISLRGDWPKSEYLDLLRIQLHLLQALGQVGHALVRLDSEWRRKLLNTTAFLNQPLIADVTSTFSLISLALREGAPLPEATPGPLLDRLLYHDSRLRLLTGQSSSASEGAPAQVEGASMGDFELTYDLLKDERFGVYSNALNGLASILMDGDELELAAKRLVGETAFPHYASLLERRARARV